MPAAGRTSAAGPPPASPPAVCAATGGLDALFAPAPLEDRTGSERTSRWTAEAAWGFPASGGRYTASPHAGPGLAPRCGGETVVRQFVSAAQGLPGRTLHCVTSHGSIIGPA